MALATEGMMPEQAQKPVAMTGIVPSEAKAAFVARSNVRPEGRTLQSKKTVATREVCVMEPTASDTRMSECES